MKKLLSILGAMTLIWTASTNVIACDNNKFFQIECSELFGTKGEIRSLISDKNNRNLKTKIKSKLCII